MNKLDIYLKCECLCIHGKLSENVSARRYKYTVLTYVQGRPTIGCSITNPRRGLLCLEQRIELLLYQTLNYTLFCRKGNLEFIY